MTKRWLRGLRIDAVLALGLPASGICTTTALELLFPKGADPALKFARVVLATWFDFFGENVGTQDLEHA